MSQDLHTMHTWRPEMIRLTQIGFSGVANGQPTPVFVDPNLIVAIRRAAGQYSVPNPDAPHDPSKRIYHEPVECTELIGPGNIHIAYVTEAPTVVWGLREHALGNRMVPPQPDAAPVKAIK